MGEYECRADTIKNRLYIRLSGFFRAKDAGPVLRDLEAALENLTAGFDVITDIAGFVPVSPETISALRSAAELVKRSGRRNAVRVTGSLVSGLMQFKRVLRPVFNEDAVHYARSIEDADAILDGLISSDQEDGA